MSKTVQIDVSGVTRALKLYAQVTRKDMPAVVNRAARNIAFRAAQFTPRVPLAQIDRDLRENDVNLKLVSKKGMTRLEISKAAKDLRTKRRRSSGSMKAGWIPALQSLGKPGDRAAGVRLSRKGFPAKGKGVPAKPSVAPFAEIENAARGIQVRGKPALKRAADFVAKDMTEYATKKLQQRKREVFR